MFFLSPDPSKLYIFMVPILFSETIGTGFGNFTVEYGLEGISTFITNGQGGPQVTIVITCRPISKKSSGIADQGWCDPQGHHSFTSFLSGPIAKLQKKDSLIVLA